MFGSVFPSIDNTGKDDLILAVGPRPSSDLMRTTEKTWLKVAYFLTIKSSNLSAVFDWCEIYLILSNDQIAILVLCLLPQHQSFICENE